MTNHSIVLFLPHQPIALPLFELVPFPLDLFLKVPTEIIDSHQCRVKLLLFFLQNFLPQFHSPVPLLRPGLFPLRLPALPQFHRPVPLLLLGLFPLRLPALLQFHRLLPLLRLWLLPPQLPALLLSHWPRFLLRNLLYQILFHLMNHCMNHQHYSYRH